MSVPSWKQRLSKTQFIWRTYNFNIRLGQMLHNKIPKKYKTNYADKIIKYASDALMLLLRANDLKISKKLTDKQFEEREACLSKAKSLIDYVGVYFFILYDLCKGSNEISNDKYYKNCEYVGGEIEDIIKLITGVEESDINRWSKIKQNTKMDEFR